MSQSDSVQKADHPVTGAIAHVSARSHGKPLESSLRVTLNFHPERITRGGRPLLVALAQDGVYRSQFETGTSNGGLTAHVGGDRWRWESRIFGGWYDTAPAEVRPKYGALNFRRKPAGGSPRFGSAHLRLNAETLQRTTFCYPDSVFEPERFGVAARMALVPIAEADARDPLDDYIEAQVHSSLLIERDVEALVLDPCFRGTEIETLAQSLPCLLEWHPGFRLSTDDLARQAHFRGQPVVELGLTLAVDGRLDARIIGEAAGAEQYDPQTLKRLWHCVARFGQPIEP